MATAYVAFGLMVVSLSLGPLNLLRARPNPVHNILRRDFGIAAGIAALVHTALGLQVHKGGAILRYFIVERPVTPREIAFIGANYFGLASAAVLAMLIAISNNPSIRTLGLAKWKRVQRFVYWAAVAAVVHGLLYQVSEGRRLILIILVLIVSLGVAGLQARGAKVIRMKKANAARGP